MVYRREEESVRDLIQYPTYVWCKENPHYGEEDKAKFVRELEKDVREQHANHKKQVRKLLEEVGQ